MAPSFQMTQQSSLFLAFMYANFFLARRGQKKKKWRKIGEEEFLKIEGLI